ncbi:10045_t:CDS:2, partial [Acaulospora morrowiae]
VRCSYIIVDHREQVVGPNALSFNLDGSKIYCGYKNMIKIYNTNRPGYDGDEYPTTPARKSKEGQK